MYIKNKGGSNMSSYNSVELVIKSDNKESVINALKDLSESIYLISNSGTLKQVGSSFILVQTIFDSIYTLHDIEKTLNKVARKYCCEIEAILSGVEWDYSEHYYNNGKKAIFKGGLSRSYRSDMDNVKELDYFFPLTFQLSVEAAEAFLYDPDTMLKKWFGIYRSTIDPWQYFYGRGYNNTERFINLDLYYKVPGEMNVKDKKILDNGKTVVTYDFDDFETRYEYDDGNHICKSNIDVPFVLDCDDLDCDDFDCDDFESRCEFDNGNHICKSNIEVDTWYKYNTEGKLIEERSDYEITRYSYDNQGRLIYKEKKESNCFGIETWYEYNAEGKLIEVRETCNNITRILGSYSYDRNGTLIHCKNEWREIWWNSNGEKIHRNLFIRKPRRIDSKDPEEILIKKAFYEYNNEGKLIKEFYPKGYYIYDESNDKDSNECQIPSVPGYYIWYEYNDKGLLKKETDSDGHKVFHFYDNNGKECRKICSNANDKIVYETDFKNKEFWYEYDENGNLNTRIDKYGNESNRSFYN